MLNVGYFIISLGIFLLFSLFISLLGYFFQYFLFKKFKNNSISLLIFLESFGIGTGLFIFYSYFIIDFLRAFNFFTIYLPLVIFDLISLIYIVFKLKILKNGRFIIYFKKIFSSLLNKEFRVHFIILSISFSLLCLVQGVIETNLSLPSKDAYIWVDAIFYLNKYGDLNYQNSTVHGVGFAIFIAGALLITNNFYIQYFFVKYVSIFYFSIIILAVYYIADFYFKKKYEIFVTLLVLLSFNSLLIRFSFVVPSIISTTLGIIYLSTFTQNESYRILIIRGILLGGMFLTHPLYFLFLFAFLIIYELFNIFIIFIKEFKTKEHNYLEKIKFLLKNNSLQLCIVLIFSIPYFLNLIFNAKNIYENFTRYLYRGYEASLIMLDDTSIILKFEVLLFIALNPSRSDFFYNLIYFGLGIPINKTMNWGVIFLILGILFNTKLNNSKEKYLIDFIKFTFLFTFLLFIINSFLFIVNNNLILSIASFINQYGLRLFELFSPFWALLFPLGVSTILDYLKRIKLKKIKNDNNNLNIILEKLNKKYQKAYLLLIFVLGGAIYSSHLYIQYNILYNNSYEDDDLTEALLFIGDYFNSKDIEDKTLIVPDNFDPKVIYRLIYHKDCELVYFEYDNTNHTQLMDIVSEEEADFVLVYKLETKDSCLEKIEDEEDILYENPHFLFFKY